MSLSNRRHNRRHSLTLIELIIAIVIFTTVILGFFSMDLFSRRQVASSDRLAKLQNDLSYALEHMTKNISRAAGRADQAVLLINENVVLVDIDENDDGRLTSTDRPIRYEYGTGTTDTDIPDHELWYYSDASDPCCDSKPHEVIATRITLFEVSLTGNYLNVKLAARWDPTAPSDTSSNPEVEMETKIKMPGVTAH